ncbi:unnamed protein product [Pseudo-nitzschia multistriata]|uniref:Plastid lipid-associated protein/fibrillin conserved domain-containing protein n=1 Tax=Pseudo-nitzschia multistriata TaxID=183589 RepID=A0A448ZMU0_9STRA|nr:unnamed protein product [Pseudo-nitzschia multistriata]
MGVARTNSPTTVTHIALEDVAKTLHDVRHDVCLVTSLEKEDHRTQDQPPETPEEDSASFKRRRELKTKLRALISDKNGCTEDKEVADAVKKLSELNPHPVNCARFELFPGEYFTRSSPNFPGRIKPSIGQEDIVQYTLGRLSFNIFQPNELLCTVKSIRNPVHPQYYEHDETAATFSYHFVLELTIHAPEGDLDATLINRATCREDEKRNNRMIVTFQGSTLIPGNHSTVDHASTLVLWEKTFANAYKKADEQRSYFGWVYQYFLKLILGLSLPSDSRTRFDSSFHFDMKRPPKGFFDVLYLDEDMRITRGNRGTISVVERASPIGFSP